MNTAPTETRLASEEESLYAWLRLLASMAVSTIGGVGMWSIVVVLPTLQSEFGVDRAAASLPYTFVMIGFVIGGPLMGWLSDRFGIVVPVATGAVALAAGLTLASVTDGIWQFAAVNLLLVGIGSSASFGPVIADISLWFTRRRGIAVALASSGAYFAGMIWPLVIQPSVAAYGWRATYVGIAAFCLAAMLPLTLVLRRPSPGARTGGAQRSAAALKRAAPLQLPSGLSPGVLQALLIVAGLLCCIAMAMPQVHIVAYCVDLGFGAAAGAQMLSLMLGTGIISRLGFGLLADRIGAIPTLLVSSALQALTLLLYLGADQLTSLYLVSALFGLVQGGIVPTYTLIIRDYFPPSEAGTRVTIVLSATLGGMAIGGWMSGAIFDATLSYNAAFLNGFAWNLLNLAIAGWLLWRLPRPRALATA